MSEEDVALTAQAEEIERLRGGFTQEDVDALRVLAAKYDDDADNHEPATPASRWLTSLANRIAARLPENP